MTKTKRKPHGKTRALKSFAPKAKPQVEEDKLASAKAQGQAQFDSIKEMVEALEGHEAAAVAAGWTGPHKDKFGATFFKNEDGATWACGTWKELCEAHDIEPDGDNEDARRTIEEDALSVQVRSGWYSPGADPDDIMRKPCEYEILLCTGGPACRIVGDIGDHGEPETARLEVQDWFTPWTAMRPLVGMKTGSAHDVPDYDSEPILLAYARCFYFGEG